MIKFDNKLEMRFFFNDKSTYMDAMIKHRCEKEVLSLIRSLGDLLDVKMTVYNEPCVDEIYKEIWAVAGENARSISIVLNIFMQIITRPLLSVGGHPLVERSLADEERMQRDLALFRRELRLKKASVMPRELIDLLNTSPRFLKIKSN